MVLPASFVLGRMMTSSNGNIFRVTIHLCGEFTGHQWQTTIVPIKIFLDLLEFS